VVEIIWLEEARLDLKDIFDYISRDSKRYAQRQVDKVFERAQLLLTHINAGKIVEEIGQSEIRELIEGNYRIVYRIIDKEKVHILLVHHGARDLTKRLES
jgi:addiction module RelE/StbE family toxin